MSKEKDIYIDNSDEEEINSVENKKDFLTQFYLIFICLLNSEWADMVIGKENICPLNFSEQVALYILTAELTREDFINLMYVLFEERGLVGYSQQINDYIHFVVREFVTEDYTKGYVIPSSYSHTDEDFPRYTN